MHLKRAMRKGCQMFTILVSDLADGGIQEVSLDDHSIL